MTTIKLTKTDYKHIRAWGAMMGSHQYYINGEIEKARRDNAPDDAIYERDGVWKRFADVEREETKVAMAEILRRIG